MAKGNSEERRALIIGELLGGLFAGNLLPQINWASTPSALEAILAAPRVNLPLGPRTIGLQ